MKEIRHSKTSTQMSNIIYAILKKAKEQVNADLNAADIHAHIAICFEFMDEDEQITYHIAINNCEGSDSAFLARCAHALHEGEGKPQPGKPN